MHVIVPKQDPYLHGHMPRSYYGFNDLRWEIVVRFDIGGIVDHYSLNVVLIQLVHHFCASYTLFVIHVLNKFHTMLFWNRYIDGTMKYRHTTTVYSGKGTTYSQVKSDVGPVPFIYSNV